MGNSGRFVSQTEGFGGVLGCGHAFWLGLLGVFWEIRLQGLVLLLWPPSFIRLGKVRPHGPWLSPANHGSMDGGPAPASEAPVPNQLEWKGLNTVECRKDAGIRS